VKRLRALILQGIDALPDAWSHAIRRELSSARAVIGRRLHRDRRPIELPGEGPVVLLDVRGFDADSVAAMLGDDPAAKRRIVLMSDDPRVDRYRSGPFAAVEYLPAASTAPAALGSNFERRRIDEIRRVYRVDSVVRGADDPSDLGWPDA